MTFFSKDFHKVSIENMAIAAREVFEKEITEMSYDFENAVAAPSTVPIVNRFTDDDVKQSKWFNAGMRAKQRGYGDFSPFYENKTADYFFKCGYAGTSFAEAQQVLKEKIQQIMESNPLITEVTNEYASKQI